MNSKSAQWVPVSTTALQLRSDAATQTAGLFYPSQRHINQKNDEMDKKLNAVKEMYERRPVVLTAVSPGKGYWRKQMEHVSEHLKAHAANDTDFRMLIGEPRMGKLLSATVREDGYELSLTVNFALRSSGMLGESGSYGGGLPTGNMREAFGSRAGARRSSLTRYASQESLVSNDSLSARSRPSSRRSARRPKKTELKRTASATDISGDDKKLLKEIGKNGEGRPDEVQQLIDEGCNPSCVSKEGKPALHVAVLAGHADVVPVLVQAGADVNRKGPNQGNAALHEAVTITPVSDDVIDALLGCGALVGKKNDRDETPFDLAIKNGHDAVAKKFTTCMSQSTLSRMSKPRGPSPGLLDERP